MPTLAFTYPQTKGVNISRRRNLCSVCQFFMLAVDEQFFIVGIIRFSVKAEKLKDRFKFIRVALDSRKLGDGIPQLGPGPCYGVKIRVAPEYVELGEKAVFQVRH